MDGWVMDGWVDGWMWDGSLDGWMDGWIDRNLGQMDRGVPAWGMVTDMPGALQCGGSIQQGCLCWSLCGGFRRAELSTVSPAVSDPKRSSCPRGAPPAPGQQLSKQSRADGMVLLGLGAAGAGIEEGELSAPAGHGLMDGKERLPTIQRGPPSR